jgi:hypothetical protein
LESAILNIIINYVHAEAVTPLLLVVRRSTRFLLSIDCSFEVCLLYATALIPIKQAIRFVKSAHTI